MGNCCNVENMSPDSEINKCNSIEELIELLKNRIEEFKIEQQQIQDYLDKKRNDIEFFDEKSLGEDDIKMRKEFLSQLILVYTKVAKILAKNNEMNVEELKYYLEKISEKYNLCYDKYNDLDKEYINFQQYTDKYKDTPL